MSKLLDVSNLSVQFQQLENKVLALDNVSFDIPDTSYTIGLVGESGSGKSTLAMSIMNLIERPGRITSGAVEFSGRNVLSMSDDELRRFRWEDISMVYQSAMNSLNPVKRVTDPIAEVLVEHRHFSKKDAEDRAKSLLSEVGISGKRVRDYPHEFSGGMRQRVVIALALALSPKLLIADEPTSALDVVTQKQILALIKREVAQKNLSLIFITHEIALLRGLVDYVAVMFQGEIVERGAASKVMSKPQHPYTEELIGSVLTANLTSGARNAPAMLEEESGVLRSPEECKYAVRCKYAFDRCRRERPVLRKTENGWWVSCHKYE